MATSYQRMDRLSSRMVEVTYGNNEWKTPTHIVEMVEETLGIIDLDPASDEPMANGTYNVPAEQHMTKADNSLNKEWHGNIFLNPPYGTEIGAFVDKLVQEIGAQHIKQAIVLVANRSDTAWYDRLMDAKPKAVCQIRKRLKFLDKNNIPISGTQFSSVVFYYGPNPSKFLTVFSRIGTCLWPVPKVTIEALKTLESENE